MRDVYGLIGFLALAALAPNDFGAVTPNLKGYSCRRQAQQILTQWKAQEIWNRAPTLVAGEKQFLSPAEEFGTWVSLSYGDRHRDLTLTKRNAAGTIQVKFASNCEAQENKTAAAALAESEFFTDAQLLRHLSENPKGVIYVWHPGFVYSQKFKATFERTAKQLGYSFLTVLAATVEPSEIGDILRKYEFSTPQLKEGSLELSYRASSNHYPRTYIFQHRRLARAPVYGVMSEEQFGKILAQSEKSQ